MLITNLWPCNAALRKKSFSVQNQKINSTPNNFQRTLDERLVILYYSASLLMTSLMLSRFSRYYPDYLSVTVIFHLPHYHYCRYHCYFHCHFIIAIISISIIIRTFTIITVIIMIIIIIINISISIVSSSSSSSINFFFFLLLSSPLSLSPPPLSSSSSPSIRSLM